MARFGRTNNLARRAKPRRRGILDRAAASRFVGCSPRRLEGRRNDKRKGYGLVQCSKHDEHSSFGALRRSSNQSAQPPTLICHPRRCVYNRGVHCSPVFAFLLLGSPVIRPRHENAPLSVVDRLPLLGNKTRFLLRVYACETKRSKMIHAYRVTKESVIFLVEESSNCDNFLLLFLFFSPPLFFLIRIVFARFFLCSKLKTRYFDIRCISDR